MSQRLDMRIVVQDVFVLVWIEKFSKTVVDDWSRVNWWEDHIQSWLRPTP